MARADHSKQLASLSLSLSVKAWLGLPPNCSERNRVNTFALSKLGRLGPEASSSRRSLLLAQRKNGARGEGARGGGMAAMAGSRTSSTSPLCALASPRTIHIRFGAIAQLARKERSFTSLRAIRLKKKKGKEGRKRSLFHGGRIV